MGLGTALSNCYIRRCSKKRGDASAVQIAIATRIVFIGPPSGVCKPTANDAVVSDQSKTSRCLTSSIRLRTVEVIRGRIVRYSMNSGKLGKRTDDFQYR
jgi:hypothetical protein